jgi:surfeit locus 1 family protein
MRGAILGFRPALRPTLITVPIVALMLALGTWQVERLIWKRALIGTIESRLRAEPVALPEHDIEGAAWEYRRVTLVGRFRHDQEIHLLAHNGRGNLGYHIIAPLQRPDGGVVLVNRGWVPSANKNPATRALGQLAGEVTVHGLVRKPWRQGWFVPDNDPTTNQWFHGDVDAMWRHLNVAGGVVGPRVIVDADAGLNPGGFPIGGHTRLTMPNNHLYYAITWYGAALALLAIYVVWHRQQGR